MYDLNWPKLSPVDAYATAKLRVKTEDFFVDELMDVPLADEGEHVWLHIEKRGDNTEYVAKLIARLANVRQMDVGFSGLKDRHAVTRQWFSVYLANRPEPQWQRLEDEGIKVLSVKRHTHKLRRGSHSANHFEIVLRDFQGDTETAKAQLERVGKLGFPNYFGEQRFGREGANIERAARWFAGEIKASRGQRGFYLSAARSYLFNQLIAHYIQSNDIDLLANDGAFYGESRDPDALNAREKAVFEGFKELTDGLNQNRIQLEQRPMLILPQDFTYTLDDHTLILRFTLPTGVFATSLLREIADYVDCSQLQEQV